VTEEDPSPHRDGSSFFRHATSQKGEVLAMKVVHNFAEPLTGSGPTDHHNAAARPAALGQHEIQPEENGLHAHSQATTNPPSGSKDIVRIPLDQIFIDGSIFPRAALDIYTVQQYTAALIRGDHLPPIIVEETKEHDYRVLRGVHRYQAYLLRCDIYTKKLVGDFYDEPLPLISETELNTIPSFIDTVPPDIHPMVFAMQDNLKNGKPLTTDDYKKIARQLYMDNKGAPITDLAELINISRKVFTKYVADLAQAFEEEKQQRIVELNNQGVSAPQISHTLKKEFPKAKGLGKSQVGDFLLNKETAKKAINEDKYNASEDHKDLDENVRVQEEKAAILGGVECVFEPIETSPKPVELKVIYGNGSDAIMILGLTSLVPYLQEKMRVEVEKLVNQIREENRVAPNNENPADPEPHDEPTNPKTVTHFNQTPEERVTAQFHSAIQPSRGSRPRTHAM
jgi:hypothetical protein